MNPLTLSGYALAAVFAPHWRDLRAALRDPQRAQLRVLHRLLRANAATHFGRAHSFARIANVADFRSQVPRATYDTLTPFLQRAAAGEASVLTGEAVVAFERTSGSTGANKEIPITRSFLREMRSAVYPWLYDLTQARPGLVGTTSYWSISPLARPPGRTIGGIPVGLSSDADYFGPLARRLLTRRFAVPPAVAMLPDIEICRYVTALYLLNDTNLGFISVWSPSFLTLLLETIEGNLGGLLADLADGDVARAAGATGGLAMRPNPDRALQLQRAFDGAGGFTPRAAWPKLRVVSCWTSAASAALVPDLKERLGTVEIQGKGLLATEGVVSIPLTGHPGAAVVSHAHFLEFVDVMDLQGTPRMVHELRLGATYEVLLTTGAGLYRYALGDLVKVVGQVGQTPLVEFVGRVDGRCDLRGEKLSPTRVGAVLGQAARDTQVDVAFAMLAPEHDGYVLFAESRGGDVERLRERVETLLMEGEHYAYCRRLGQLRPVQAVIVRDALRRYERRALAHGQRAGEIKLTPLHTATDWRKWMAGDAA